MTQSSSLDVFLDIVAANYDVHFLEYDFQGEYIHSNYDDPMPYDRIFSYLGCKEYTIQYLLDNSKPLLLHATLGLTWIAVFAENDVEKGKIYVLGPMFIDKLSEKNIEHRLQAFNTDVAILQGPLMISLIKSLPVIPIYELQQLAVMMHYCVNGVKLDTQNINYQNKILTLSDVHTVSTEKEIPTWDWDKEQKLLYTLQQGDVTYKDKVDVIQTINNLISAEMGGPLNHDKYAAVIMVSLCTRAAVQGGMLYDKAYALSNFYYQSIELCNSVKEIQTFVLTMYDEFVHRVAESRKQTEYSKPIKACCEYIHQHLEDDLSVSILARRLGYADYYLTNKFKAETGQNLRNYIRATRIQQAKFLLSNSAFDIQQISDTLHFGNRNYFTETFRKLVGVTPAEYRKQNRKFL